MLEAVFILESHLQNKEHRIQGREHFQLGSELPREGGRPCREGRVEGELSHALHSAVAVCSSHLSSPAVAGTAEAWDVPWLRDNWFPFSK